MTQQDKQLLLKDLCARLPYRVKYCTNIDIDGMRFSTMTIDNIKLVLSGEYKPYLRPMSSMTEDEAIKYQRIDCGFNRHTWLHTERLIDWLNSHHFDFRGLIDKSLALEAPEGMYK